MSTLCGKNRNLCNLKAVDRMKVNALLNITEKGIRGSGDFLKLDIRCS